MGLSEARHFYFLKDDDHHISHCSEDRCGYTAKLMRLRAEEVIAQGEQCECGRVVGWQCRTEFSGLAPTCPKRPPEDRVYWAINPLKEKAKAEQAPKGKRKRKK